MKPKSPLIAQAYPTQTGHNPGSILWYVVSNSPPRFGIQTFDVRIPGFPALSKFFLVFGSRLAQVRDIALDFKNES